MKLFMLVLVLVLVHPAISKGISLRRFEQPQDKPVLAKRSGNGDCYANGDPHFQTFDNKYYDFMGACRYVQLTDYCGNRGRHAALGEFKVVTDNENCGRSVSCIRAVDVTIGDDTIHLRRGTSAPANMDGPGYTVRLEGSNVVVRSSGLTLKWDMKMYLSIQLADRFRGKVCGLCGNFDGNPNNDFIMSNGLSTGDVNTFGKSWQAGGKCGKPVPPQHPCEAHPDRRKEAKKDCAVIKSDHFQNCRGSAVNLDIEYNNCVYDVCAGTSLTMRDSSCEAIKATSLKCKDQTGLPVSWGHLEDKCKCQRKANIDGRFVCCHFPFEYKGVWFYDCVPQRKGGKPWCSIAKKTTWKTSGECI